LGASGFDVWGRGYAPSKRGEAQLPHSYTILFGIFAQEAFSMSVTVQIPTALRRLTAGTPRVVCSVANLSELFSELDQQFPDLKPHLRDEAGETRRFLNIYVNEEDIRFLGGASYSFQDGDEVLLVPSIAGGSR